MRSAPLDHFFGVRRPTSSIVGEEESESSLDDNGIRHSSMEGTSSPPLVEEKTQEDNSGEGEAECKSTTPFVQNRTSTV